MKMRVAVFTLAIVLIGVTLFAADGDLIVSGRLSVSTTGQYPEDIALFGQGATGVTYIGIGPAVATDQAGFIGYDPANNVMGLAIGGDAIGHGLVQKRGGNVGIGTTSPSYPLHVNGATYCTSGAWAGSDIRLKKNIEPIKNAIPLIQGLQGVRFDWKRDEFKDKNLDDGKQIGLIAQDVEKVLPELVKTDKEGYKAVSYDKLTAVLVEAIKDQQIQISQLRAEIEKLKGK